MTYGVYCIRDAKTGFMTPTIDQTDYSAIRNFVHAVCTSDGILHTHASDFDLYFLGHFNTETGEIVPKSVPMLLFSGSSASLGSLSSTEDYREADYE